MGARQTKEGNFPTTPTQYSKSKQVGTIEEDNIDPRSPIPFRTPINVSSSQRIDTIAQLVPVENDRPNSDNPLEILRKRFFKGLYNINDPRSPNLNLNRTPLIFEDSSERTLNLDDTFADLFVGSNIQEESKSCNDFEMAECIKTAQTLASEMEEMPMSPIALQQQFDPRSPSIGVERTPIIFNEDDNDANEDVILENILATLTLNLNESGGGSSIVSTNSSDIHINEEDKKEIVHKPTNRHLDRVRVGKKVIPKGPHRRQKRVLLRQKIYEDRENQPTTPHLKTQNVYIVDSPKCKRTPLSCVRNSAQVRSRSLESSARSVKTRLPIMSFDDTLNPNENTKIPSIRVMSELSQDSLL